MLGEPRGEQPRRHRQAGLADAVLAAIDRRHLRRHRRDEDDRRRRTAGSARAPRDLVARDGLGQEVRSLQVRAEQLVEALLGRLEQVGADARRPPGVVDERVDARRSVRARASTQPRAIVAARDVGREVVDARRRVARSSSSTPATSASARTPHEREVPAVARERARDAEADAARAAGDERAFRASCGSGGPREEASRYGRALGEPLDVERRFARVVVAPLARFAARRRGAGRHVVPAVRPVIDRVQQQSLMARIGAQVRSDGSNSVSSTRSPACS